MNKGTVTDLSYIRSMAGDSKELIDEMIGIFISQVPELVGQMRDYFENSDWKNLGLTAHKAKSSVSIMGIETQSVKLKELELKCKANTHQDEYIDYIDSFETDCNAALIELEEVINNQKN